MVVVVSTDAALMVMYGMPGGGGMGAHGRPCANPHLGAPLAAAAGPGHGCALDAHPVEICGRAAQVASLGRERARNPRALAQGEHHFSSAHVDFCSIKNPSLRASSSRFATDR